MWKTPIALTLSLLSAQSFAEDFDLKDVPRLHQVQVFRSPEKDRFIVLGKDGIYGDSGNWYVLDWNQGKLRVPKLKPQSFFYFGGGFDFHYESGEWLFIPAGNSDINAPGALNESIPPGIISPQIGRTPLKKIDVLSVALFNSLNVADKISPQVFEQQVKIEASKSSEKKLSAPQEEIVMLKFTYSDKDGDKDMGREVRNHLREQNDSLINLQNLWGSGDTEVYVWAFESQVDSIQKVVQAKLGRLATVQRHILEGDAIEKVIVDPDGIYKLGIMEAVRHAAAAFKSLEEKFPSLNSQQADELVIQIHTQLHVLGQALEWQQRTVYALNRWQKSGKAMASLKRNFASPLENLLSRGYALLDKIQTPMARKVLLFAGEKHNGRLDFMDRSSGNGQGTYFQVWLKTLKDRITWVMKTDPTQLGEMSVRNSGGGVLQQFNFLNVDLKTYSPREQEPPYIDDDRLATYPLLIFGLRNSPNYRQDVVRLIVEMDKVAEYQRVNFKDQYSTLITGNKLLSDFIRSLSYAAVYDAELNGIKGFSRALYYKQVMMILTEILNTSRITITNNATYLTLLDAAISTQRNVRYHFGTVPNAGKKKTPVTDELTEQLLHLQNAVQVRLLRAAYGNREECNRILLPN